MLGIAYWEARGVNQLLAASVVSGGVDGTVRGPRRIEVDDAQPTAPSGDGVLARNPFDSETGPLLGGPGMHLPVAGGGDPQLPEQPPGPDDPTCDFGRVVLISAVEGADQSFATIERRPGDTAMVRQGDDFDGRTVAVIDWDRVWFAERDRHCQLKIGVRPAALTRTTTAPEGGRRGPRVGRSPRALAPRQAAKIERVSPTEIRVERSLIEELAANPRSLQGIARAVPPRAGERGMKLLGVGADSLLGHLGLQNGDRVESINGFDLTNPRAVLQAYGVLQRAENLSVQLQRGGKPLTLDIVIH